VIHLQRAGRDPCLMTLDCLTKCKIRITPSRRVRRCIITRRLINSLLSVAIATAILWPAIAAEASAYDGRWWQSSSQDQRAGFLAGQLDCAIYEAGQTQLSGVSWYALGPEITRYYNDPQSNRQTPIRELIPKLSFQKKLHQVGRKGENTPEKHGVFDGEYWRQSPPEHRAGFVDGFLDCYLRLPSKSAGFSQTHGAYVSEISRWYGVNEDDPSRINEKRSGAKVANVLFQFQDRVTNQPRKH
jgi:hypothetical protein